MPASCDAAAATAARRLADHILFASVCVAGVPRYFTAAMDEQSSEMSVGSALDRIEEQLRGAKMLPTGQRLSEQLSFATPGFFRLDQVRGRRRRPPPPLPQKALPLDQLSWLAYPASPLPWLPPLLQLPKVVFLFGVSEGKCMSQADVDAHKRLAACGDIAGSPLPAGEKLWLLKKAGALDSLNPYGGQALAAGGQPQLGSLLQDGRVLQELVRRGDVWLLQASKQTRRAQHSTAQQMLLLLLLGCVCGLQQRWVLRASSHARCLPSNAAMPAHTCILPLLGHCLPLLQASPIGTHDAVTRKWLKAYLHSKRIHGMSQGYQVPLMNAAHQSEC